MQKYKQQIRRAWVEIGEKDREEIRIRRRKRGMANSEHVLVVTGPITNGRHHEGYNGAGESGIERGIGARRLMSVDIRAVVGGVALGR